MKIRSRDIPKVGKNHALFASFRSLTAFKRHLPSLIPHDFQTIAFERSLPQELIAQEVERKQSESRAYVSMLPPR